VGSLINRAFTPQKFIQRMLNILVLQAEDYVNARGLNIGIHDADTPPLCCSKTAMLAVVFDLPVPPRNEWIEMILDMISAGEVQIELLQ